MDITNQLSQLENEVSVLADLTSKVYEGRFARKNLAKAELSIKEIGQLVEREEYYAAEGKILKAYEYMELAKDILLPIYRRYNDANLIKKWGKWISDTIHESQKYGSTAIIVSKIDRILTIYKNGKPVKSYKIGIGRNGSRDKLYQGDGATPEGKYRITKKLTASKYYKALLLNYPNDEDIKEFNKAKKKGIIPQKANIGGLIEIHGGGTEGMTYGCISLENRDMDEVFEEADVDTLVTIVGMTENKITLK